MSATNRDNSARNIGRLRAATIVPKPWGRELWFANEDQYAGKILEVAEGHALSLQKHEFKTETLYLLSGRSWFHLNGLEFDFIPGSCLTIYPGDLHRLHALEDSVVLEVNTPHLSDVISLEDNYGRQ